MSETFWLFVVATGSAIVGLVLKYSFDSKCSDVECCGIKIKRDVKSEINVEEFKIEHGIKPQQFSLPRFETKEEI